MPGAAAAYADMKAAQFFEQAAAAIRRQHGASAAAAAGALRWMPALPIDPRIRPDPNPTDATPRCAVIRFAISSAPAFSVFCL